jgi:hypothetical protein
MLKILNIGIICLCLVKSAPRFEFKPGRMSNDILLKGLLESVPFCQVGSYSIGTLGVGIVVTLEQVGKEK